MGIKASKDPQGVATIAIVGRFDFSSLEDFTHAYQSLESSTQAWVVDFAGTQFIDSSALGMLLIFRDFAGGDASRIRMINCSIDVQRALMTFEDMFDISGQRAG